MKKIILNDIKDFNSETGEVSVSLRDGNEIIEAKMTVSEVDGNFVFANENFNFTLDKDFNVLDAKSGDEEIKLEGKVDSNIDLSSLENVSSSDFDLEAHTSKESFDFVQTAEADTISTDKDETQDIAERPTNDFGDKFSFLKNVAEKRGRAMTTIDKNVKVYANKIEGSKAIQYEMNYTILDKNGLPTKTIYFGTRVPDVFKNNFEQIKEILDGIFNNPELPTFLSGEAVVDFLNENHFSDQVNSVLEADGMENQLYAFVGEKGNNLKIDGLMTHSEFEQKLEQKTDDDEDKSENKGKGAQNKVEKNNEPKEDKDDRSKVDKAFDKITDPSEKFSYEFKSMEATWKLPKNSDSSFTVNSYYVDKDPLLDGQKMMVPAYTYTNEKGELVYERFVGDTPQLVNRTDADGFKPVNVTWELNKALGSSAGKKEPLISAIVDMIAGFEASKGFADGESMDEFKEELADVIKKSSDAFQGRRVTYTPTYDKNGNLVSGSEIKGSQTTGTDIMGMAEFVSLLNQGFGLTARMNALELAPNTLAELRQDENFDVEKMTPEQTAKILAEAKQTLDDKENELGSRIIVSADGKNKNAEIIKLRIQKTLYDQVFANYETILNDSNDLTRSAANKQKGLYHDMHAKTAFQFVMALPTAAVMTGVIGVPLIGLLGFSLPLLGVLFAGMFAINAVLAYRNFHKYFKDHFEARRDFVKNGVDIRIPRARIDNPEKLPKGYSYDKETGTLIMKVKLSPAELRKFEQANKLYKTTEKKVNGEETDTRKQRSEFLMQYLEAKGLKQLLDNGFNELKDRGEVIDVLDGSNRQLNDEIKKKQDKKLDKIEEGDEDDVEKDEDGEDEAEKEEDEEQVEDGEDTGEDTGETGEDQDEGEDTSEGENPDETGGDNVGDVDVDDADVDASFDDGEDIDTLLQRGEDYESAIKVNSELGNDIKSSCDKLKEKLESKLKEVDKKLETSEKGSPERMSLLKEKVKLTKDIAKLDNIKNRVDLKDLDIKIDSMSKTDATISDCYKQIDALLNEKANLLLESSETLSAIKDIDNDIAKAKAQLNELIDAKSKVDGGYNDKLDSQISKNQAKIDKLSAELKNLALEKGSKTRQINALDKKIEAIDKMISNLDKTSKDLEKLSAEVKNLGDDYKDLAEKIEGSSNLTEAREALEAKKAELEKLKDTLDKQRDNIDKKRDNIKDQIDAEKGKIEKHQKQKIDTNDIDKKIEELNETISDLEAQKSGMNSDVSEKVKAIDAKIDALKGEIGKYNDVKEKYVEGLKTERDALSQKVESSSSEHGKGDLKQRVLDFLKTELPSRKTYESIQDQIKERKEFLSNELDIEKNPGGLDTSVRNAYEKELEDLTNLSFRLEDLNGVHEVYRDIADINNKIDAIDSQINALKDVRDTLTSELEALKDEKAQEVAKLEEAQNELAEISKAYKEEIDLDKKISKVKGEIEETRNNIQTLKENVEKLESKRSEIDGQIKELEAKKAKLEKALDQIEKGLDSIDSIKDIEDLIDKDLLKDLKDDAKSLDKIKDVLTKEKDAIDNAEKTLRTDRAEVGRKIGGAKRSIDAALKKIENLELTEKGYKEELESLKGRHNDEIKGAVEQKIEKIKENIKEIDKKIEGKESEIFNNKVETKKLEDEKKENVEKREFYEKRAEGDTSDLKKDIEEKASKLETKDVESQKVDDDDKADTSKKIEKKSEEKPVDKGNDDKSEPKAEKDSKDGSETKPKDISENPDIKKKGDNSDSSKTDKSKEKVEGSKNPDGRIEKDTINVTKKGFKTVIEKKARDFDVNKIGAEKPLPSINGEIKKVPSDIVNDLKEKAIQILGAEKGKTFNHELLRGKISGAEFNYASDVLDGVRQLQSTNSSMKDIANKLDIKSDDYKGFAYDVATYANDKTGVDGKKVDGTMDAISRNPDFSQKDIQNLRSEKAPKMGFFERHFGNIDASTKKFNKIASKFADIKIEKTKDGQDGKLETINKKVNALEQKFSEIGNDFETRFNNLAELVSNETEYDTDTEILEKINDLKERSTDAKHFIKDAKTILDARLAEIKSELKDLNNEKKAMNGKGVEKIEAKLQKILGEKVKVKERIEDVKTLEKAIQEIDSKLDTALERKANDLMSDLKDKMSKSDYDKFEKKMDGLKGQPDKKAFVKELVEKYKSEFQIEKIEKVEAKNERIEKLNEDKQKFEKANGNFKAELNRAVSKLENAAKNFNNKLELSDKDKLQLKQDIEKFGKSITKLEKQLNKIENSSKYSDAEKQTAKETIGKQLDLMKAEYNKANTQLERYDIAKINAERMPEIMHKVGIGPETIRNFETGNPNATIGVERIGGFFKGYDTATVDFGGVKLTGDFLPDGSFKATGYLDGDNSFTGLSPSTEIIIKPDGEIEIKQMERKEDGKYELRKERVDTSDSKPEAVAEILSDTLYGDSIAYDPTIEDYHDVSEASDDQGEKKDQDSEERNDRDMEDLEVE